MDGIRGIWHGGPFAEDKRYMFYPKMMMFGDQFLCERPAGIPRIPQSRS
jgi:hypothetical protein